MPVVTEMGYMNSEGAAVAPYRTNVADTETWITIGIDLLREVWDNYRNAPGVSVNASVQTVQEALEFEYGLGNVRLIDAALWGRGGGWQYKMPSLDGFEEVSNNLCERITAAYDYRYGWDGSAPLNDMAMTQAYGGAENVVFVRHKWYAGAGLSPVIAEPEGNWSPLLFSEATRIGNMFNYGGSRLVGLLKAYGEGNAKYVKRADKYYIRYGVRRAQHWTERESERMASRTQPVWVGELFWVQHHNVHRWHFVHVSKTDPRLLAYTIDDDKGNRDIQTPVKPGRYLSTYFKDVLSEKRIAFLSAWQASGQRPPNPFDGLEMKFATTSDEIADVYMRGPVSCMDGREFRRADIHPVRAYGAGDLAVVYVEEKPGGKVLSRALVWPEKKAAGRVYPTGDMWKRDGHDSWHDAMDIHDRMRGKLKDAGYTLAAESTQKLFDGARLLAIPADHSSHYSPTRHIRIPYLDNGYGIRWMKDGSSLIMSDPNIDSSNTYSAGGTGGVCDLPPKPEAAKEDPRLGDISVYPPPVDAVWAAHGPVAPRDYIPSTVAATYYANATLSMVSAAGSVATRT